MQSVILPYFGTAVAIYNIQMKKLFEKKFANIDQLEVGTDYKSQNLHRIVHLSFSGVFKVYMSEAGKFKFTCDKVSMFSLNIHHEVPFVINE